MFAKIAKLQPVQRLFAKKIQHVGLDIGSANIKLMEVCAETKAPLRYGSEPTNDAQSLTAGIEKLVEAKGVEQGSTVHVGISGKAVVSRQIRMPQMPVEELDQAVFFEAEKYIPGNLKNMFIDYAIIEQVEVDGVPSYNMLLASAPKDTIYSLYNSVEKAGLKPISIEVEPLSLARYWHHCYLDSDLPHQAILSLGHENGHLVAFKGEHLHYTRMLPMPQQEEMSPVLELAHQEAAVTAEEGFEPMAQDVFVGLVTEIQRSLDFYQMQAKVRLNRLIITGGMANIPGIDNYLETELKLPVLVDSYNDMDPKYSIAKGLALRELLEI
ncbi:type IV pilus assembly protein PilM [Desulfitispora alkaliphila]|uniref:pilus assembly protein PilM n=1 Tax=Desulfitispora alkaliphila TaxID=622674 RepID=UPI003D23F4CF